MSGIVPGEGETDIIVTYTPKEYVTANMTIQLSISQFNTEPMPCHITASCTPVVKQITAKSIKDLDDLYKQTKIFDPRCISPLQMARRRQKSTYRKLPEREVEYEGFQFPTKLNTQHAVNSVLMQEKGKLKVKDLREAVLAKSDSKEDSSKSSDSLSAAESTRQMKEAAFEKIVRQDVVEERANQLRWQVHLGLDPISDEARVAIAEQRKNASFVYKYTKRKEPFVDQELLRPSGKRTCQRTRRKANETNRQAAHFDLYKNNSWSVRHRALSRFQQAARTVLIRCRADKKVKMLQKMVEDFKAGITPDQFPVVGSTVDLPTGTSPFQVEVHDHNGFELCDPTDALSSAFTPTNVKPFTFPVYVSPDTKDDIAPDALGEVPYKPTEVMAQRDVPYQKLVVPKYYELAGYTRHSVYECLKNYVPPGLVRQLRVGAEDEIIRGTFAPQAIFGDEKTTKEAPSVLSAEEAPLTLSDSVSMGPSEAGNSTKSVEKQSSSGLIPPSGLFKNPPTHRLYIFNRMPGIVEHSIPLEHSEIDPDFHLCPIPRYTMLPKAKKFLNRQDVIKGTMLWKKFSSHGLNYLSNTPTLSNTWLPRWSDCLSQAMTPHCTPELLMELPEDDKQNLLTEEEASGGAFPLLTAAMVASHFPTEKDLLQEYNKLMEEEGSPKKEEYISSSRFPTYNSDCATRLGTTMRDEREMLEASSKGIYNKLGERTSELAKLCDFDLDD
uniref:Primary ciliary dyskinesia protein 1-like n=1 Tax=Phallusia mammillata TaxID=59560 RepID=A0A6F9D9X0_9ASCI|nr:primary ciliary dyskinesia protein 1-like [Phallusia mammillata]